MELNSKSLFIILIILLLLFGSSRLPKLSKSIGESARELKDAFEGKNKDETVAKDQPTVEDKQKKA